MSDNSIEQPAPYGFGPNNEPWVPKEEIKTMFNLRDRTLTYWRDERKIQYMKVSNRTYYLVSEIRAMVEHQSRPKKYFGVRKTTIKKKLRTINMVLGIAIVVALFWFVTLPLNKSDPYTIRDVSFGFKMILFFCAFYGLVRGIIYIWRRIFRNDKPIE